MEQPCPTNGCTWQRSTVTVWGTHKPPSAGTCLGPPSVGLPGQATRCDMIRSQRAAVRHTTTSCHAGVRVCGAPPLHHSSIISRGGHQKVRRAGEGAHGVLCATIQLDVAHHQQTTQWHNLTLQISHICHHHTALPCTSAIYTASCLCCCSAPAVRTPRRVSVQVLLERSGSTMAHRVRKGCDNTKA